MKLLLSALIAIYLACGFAASAQTVTNDPTDELKSLIKSIEAKIEPGKNTEADFAEELKTFDHLITVAEKEVKASEDRAKDASLALSSFRSRQSVFDPDRQATFQ